jgi:tetratricopeptide (TPR) repeat protein
MLLFIAIFQFLILPGQAQDSQVYLDSGNYYLDKKQYEKAVESLNKCLEIDDNEMEAYAYRAFAYYHLGQLSKSIEDCNRALAIHEGYAEMYNLRGLCKDQSGNREGACSDWHTAYYYGFSDSMRLIKLFCKENMPKE